MPLAAIGRRGRVAARINRLVVFGQGMRKVWRWISRFGWIRAARQSRFVQQKWGRYRYRPHSHRRVDLTLWIPQGDTLRLTCHGFFQDCGLEGCRYVVRRSRRCRIAAGSNGVLCKPPSLRAGHPQPVTIPCVSNGSGNLAIAAPQHRAFLPAIRQSLC